MSQELSFSRICIFLILACLWTLDSVRTQSLALYLNQNGELTDTPYPALPPGTTGGEFEQVMPTFSWNYFLQHDISDTLYSINLLVGCVHPNGCVMEAEFILSH